MMSVDIATARASSKLQIFGRNTSSNVQKVLWCCAELGIDYDRHDVGLKFGVNDTPEYLAMNPNGLVPTISDQGKVVWESNSIIRYLASKLEGEALYPGDAAARATVNQWLDWEISTMAVAITPVFWGLIRTPEQDRDIKAIDAGVEKLKDLWLIVDDQLQGRAFLTGDTLTLADIALGNSIHRWYAFPIERPELPALRRWYESFLERPAYREHVAKPVV